MASRLLSAAVLIPGAGGLMWLDHRLGEPAPVLFLLVLLLALKATREVLKLVPVPASAGEAARPSFAVAGTGVTLVLLAAWVPHWVVRTVPPTLPPGDILTGLGPVAAGLAGAVIYAAVRRVLRFTPGGGHAAGLAAEVFAVCYVGVALAVTCQLRWLPDTAAGYLAVGSLLAAAKAGDTGAYFTGRLIGGPKLIPRVSPGKTWAGAGGAVVWAAALTCGWLWLAGGWFGRDEFRPLRAVVFGAVVSIAGLLGDLVESVLKRDAGVKDSGDLLPGMGGMLDVLDSLLLAGPVAVLLWGVWPPA